MSYAPYFLPFNRVHLFLLKTMDIPQEDYDRLLKEIESDKSPVGIDAKKTHILILHKLQEIEERLARIERELFTNSRYNT